MRASRRSDVSRWNFNKRLLTTIGLVLAFAASAEAQGSITLQDMKALSQQKNYTELLEKAALVRPAERTPEWNQLIVSAATGLANQVATTADKNPGNLRDLIMPLQSAEKTHTFLATAKSYSDAKGRALQTAAPICQKREDLTCGSMLAILAKQTSVFPKGTARSIAMLLSQISDQQSNARFWSLAATEDASACKETALQATLFTSLRNSTDQVDIEAARDLFKSCFSAVEDKVKGVLENAQPRSQMLKNICPLLLKLGTQNIWKKKKCEGV